MCGDIPVLRYNFSSSECNVLDPLHMPFSLQNRIPESVKIRSEKDLNLAMEIRGKQRDEIIHFFASRTLSLSREYAKELLSAINFEQDITDADRYKLSLICRAVTLQDNFWVKDEKSKIIWKDINLRHNPLNNALANIALYGDVITIEGVVYSPEFNEKGVSPHAWFREDGDLFFYKLGANHGTGDESKIEVMVSKLLDKTDAYHLRYTEAECRGKYAAKCKLMATDQLSMLSGIDFRRWCISCDKDSEKEWQKIDDKHIKQMWIMDYLTANGDRHGNNWGFFYRPDSMEILGCYPVMDFNKSFSEGYMANKDAGYLFDRRMTIREAAISAKKDVSLAIKEDINRNDFLAQDQYDCFRERAEEIGINISLHRDRIAFSHKKQDSDACDTNSQQI